MIRVLLREENEPEGFLVGDFMPDQIDGLEALIRSAPIRIDGADPEGVGEISRQWVSADPPATPRWVLEFIWTSRG